MDRSRLRQSRRALWIAGLLLVGLVLALAVAISFGYLRRERLAQWWYGQALRALGVRVHWQGTRDAKAQLLVANHVSWLDILVIGSQVPSRFVSKQEVRAWPVIGWLAQASGTFFIRRGAGGTRPLLERMQPYLSAGGTVALFPEGTTTTGEDARAFHARLFDAAVVVQTPVQPLALRYGLDDDGTAIAPFVGDASFLPHLLRLMRARALTVQVLCLPALPAGDDRRTLSRQAHACIRAALRPCAPSSPELEPASAGTVGITQQAITFDAKVQTQPRILRRRGGTR